MTQISESEPNNYDYADDDCDDNNDDNNDNNDDNDDNNDDNNDNNDDNNNNNDDNGDKNDDDDTDLEPGVFVQMWAQPPFSSKHSSRSSHMEPPTSLFWSYFWW